MEIIESEMISHPQHVLSSLGQQPWTAEQTSSARGSKCSEKSEASKET